MLSPLLNFNFASEDNMICNIEEATKIIMTKDNINISISKKSSNNIIDNKENIIMINNKN